MGDKDSPPTLEELLVEKMAIRSDIKEFTNMVTQYRTNKESYDLSRVRLVEFGQPPQDTSLFEATFNSISDFRTYIDAQVSTWISNATNHDSLGNDRRIVAYQWNYAQLEYYQLK